MFTIICFRVCSLLDLVVFNLNRSICSRLQFRLRLSRVDRRDHYIPNDFFFLLRCCSRSFANRTCTRLSSHYCCRKRKLTWKIVIGIEKSHPPVILKPRVFPIPWNSSRLSELPLVADLVGACFSILNVTWGIVVDYFYRNDCTISFTLILSSPNCASAIFTDTEKQFPLIELLIELIIS